MQIKSFEEMSPDQQLAWAAGYEKARKASEARLAAYEKALEQIADGRPSLDCQNIAIAVLMDTEESDG